LEHPLNTGVHFFFLDEFTARDLVEAHLNLLFEPFVVGKQTGNRFLHQVVGVSSSCDSKLVELCFLILRQMHFHGDISRIPRFNVRIAGGERELSRRAASPMLTVTGAAAPHGLSDDVVCFGCGHLRTAGIDLGEMSLKLFGNLQTPLIRDSGRLESFYAHRLRFKHTAAQKAFNYEPLVGGQAFGFTDHLAALLPL